MKYDTPKMALHIESAVDAAQIHAGADDGGTCNCDCCYIAVPGMREKQARDIEALCGIKLRLTNYLGNRVLMVVGGTDGRANRRTRMAVAICERLELYGYAAYMYMQAD